MKSLLTQLLGSRWFVVSTHASLWLLFYLTFGGLGSPSPDFRESLARTPARHPILPETSLADFFSPEPPAKFGADTNAMNPFVTSYFIPRQAPAPPPPTTRKIELTYLGFYQTAQGDKQAIVRQGDDFLVATVGAKITANLYAAEASMQTLLVTNSAAKTNLLLLNSKKELEVPVP